MTFVFMLVVLVFPIVFLLGLAPVVNQIIASLSFALGNIVAIGLLFGEKALVVLNGHDIDLINGAVPVRRSARIADTKYNTENTQSPSEPIFANVKEAFKAIKDLDERSNLCREQLKQWEALLMQIETRDSSNSGPSSSTNNARSIDRSTGGVVSFHEDDQHVGGKEIENP